MPHEDREHEVDGKNNYKWVLKSKLKTRYNTQWSPGYFKPISPDLQGGEEIIGASGWGCNTAGVVVKGEEFKIPSEKIANKLDMIDFTVGQGWLSILKIRHKISYKITGLGEELIYKVLTHSSRN